MKAHASLLHAMASILAATSLAALSAPALADRGPGGGGGMGGSGMGGMGTTMPAVKTTPDRTKDQDRLHDGTSDQDQDQDRDQDRLHDGTGDQDRDRDQDRLHDGTGDQDRDRDQDRLHDGTGDQDQDRLRDRDRISVDQAVVGQVSSWQLLSDQERLQFHNRMQKAKSAEERNRIRSEYQNTIRQRAGDLGVAAPFGPQRAGSGVRDGYYLSQMLTEQERLQFHHRMRTANSNAERNRIRAEMQTMARERATEMGIEVPAWFAGGPNN